MSAVSQGCLVFWMSGRLLHAHICIMLQMTSHQFSMSLGNDLSAWKEFVTVRLHLSAGSWLWASVCTSRQFDCCRPTLPLHVACNWCVIAMTARSSLLAGASVHENTRQHLNSERSLVKIWSISFRMWQSFDSQEWRYPFDETMTRE